MDAKKKNRSYKMGCECGKAMLSSAEKDVCGWSDKHPAKLWTTSPAGKEKNKVGGCLSFAPLPWFAQIRAYGES